MLRTMAFAALFAILLLTSAVAEENQLSKEQLDQGWKLLFDGHSTKGWMGIDGKPLPGSHVQERALNPHPCKYMLVYEQTVENFVLALDFKISQKCNSGIFIHTSSLTPRPGKDVGFNGIEIAVDDTNSTGYHDSGAIYDLVPCNVNAMKPAGEWNHMEITSDKDRIVVQLNGKRVSEMNLAEWTEANKRPDGSDHKFDVAYKDHPRRGYIGLQDHGSDCWYRNIRLRSLEKR